MGQSVDGLEVLLMLSTGLLVPCVAFQFSFEIPGYKRSNLLKLVLDEIRSLKGEEEVWNILKF